MIEFNEIDSDTGWAVARESFKAKGMRGSDINGRESFVFVVSDGDHAKVLLNDVEEDGFIDLLDEHHESGNIDNARPSIGDAFSVSGDVVWSECEEIYRIENVKWEVL